MEEGDFTLTHMEDLRGWCLFKGFFHWFKLKKIGLKLMIVFSWILSQNIQYAMIYV